MSKKKHDCCGEGHCDDDCGCDHDDSHEHDHSHSNHGNPFANLDEKTQMQIQELQFLEQNFQQLLMQKNAFSMEKNDTDLIVSEVEKTTDEVFRIIGNQVLIKSSKEKILDEMNRKKSLIDKRLEEIDKQEREFSQKMEKLRDEVLKKIQG